MRVSKQGYRLHLDMLNNNDIDALVENANDIEVLSNNPTMPSPYERESAVALIETAIQKYSTLDEIHMGIRLSDSKLIGVCALYSIDIKNRKAEVGYWIGKKYWGQGYGKEALTLAVGLGFVHLELNKISAKVLVGNVRSIRLLESVGFSKEGINREDIFYEGKLLDQITFSILRSEHKSSVNVSMKE
jgi:RimJ/RimL family protein N-acetyltransferase